MPGKRPKSISEEKLFHLLDNDEISDIDSLSDDDLGWDESNKENENFDDLHNFDDTRNDNADSEEYDDSGSEKEADDIRDESEDNAAGPSFNKKKDIENFLNHHNLTRKEHIRWMTDAQYETRSIDWHCRNSSAETVIELPHPITFFRQYIPDSIFKQMVEMTNLYATQKNIPRFPPTTVDELKILIGVHIIMGNLQFPRVEMYWSNTCGIEIVRNNMVLKRFYKLRQALHLVDITGREPTNTDRIWKVRCLYDALRKRYRELPLECNLCVDEQMVPFKGKLNIKQYVKNKPKKWGIKIYVLAGESGMIYDFLIYQGATTEIDSQYMHFGTSAATVVQLANRITEPNHALFFDNYFSSYHLFQYLASKSIFAVGTIRINRFHNPKLPSDKDMKVQGRGSSAESISGDGIVVTKWYDNKPVMMASNFVGIGNQDNCRRWDKARKEYIQVSRPESVRRYNISMGGVDKHDFLLSLYRSYVRSRKWTIRLISHAVDLALVNSWLEYKMQATQLGVSKQRTLDLLAFRQSVAESLILTRAPPKRGRPSTEPSTESPAGSAKRNRYESRPMRDSRFDRYDHMPEYDENKNNSRCKFEGCKERTHVICTKCKVHLCLLKGRNCFKNFHTL